MKSVGNLTLVVILAFLMGIAGLVIAGQPITVTGASVPADLLAAPLGQATATNTATVTNTATATNTATPTRTSTPTRIANGAIQDIQGNRPIEQLFVPNGDGSDSQTTYCINCATNSGSAFPYAAGTSIPVRGPVGISTVVTGNNPVAICVAGYDGSCQMPIAGAADNLANTGRSLLNTSAQMMGRATADGHDHVIEANPTTNALFSQPVQPNGTAYPTVAPQFTPVPTWTAQPYFPAQAVAVATIVRPSDSTPYSANDVIASATPGILTFSDMCRANGGSGTITKVRQFTDQSTNISRIQVHLYNVAPTPIADNAQYPLLFADANQRVGAILVDPNTSEGTGSTGATSSNTTIRLPYVCAANDTRLYGIPEILDAGTPASGQSWYWQLQMARE